MLYLWYQYTIEPTKYAGRRIWERLSYVSKENDVNGREVYGRAEGEVMQQTLRQKDQVDGTLERRRCTQEAISAYVDMYMERESFR